MKLHVLRFAVVALSCACAVVVITNVRAQKLAANENDFAFLYSALGAPQPAQTPAAAAAQEKTVEQVQKNIKVLNGMPQSQLIPVMNFFAASMGRRCNFCHVNNNGQWDYAADTKPEKNTAREMIKMVLDLHKLTFSGSADISCYTCQRGFNGTVGWEKTARGVRELTGGELAQVRAANNLFGLIKLKEQFTRTRVTGKDQIGEREVYVVNGTTTDDKRQRLFFDVETG